MKCYSLLLGARNTSSRNGRFSREDETRIRELTFRYFPEGFTVLNAAGGWFDPQRRRFVQEHSRQILVCTAQRAVLRRWCAALLDALRQQELLVVELGPAQSFAVKATRAASGRRPQAKRSLRRLT